MDVLNHKFIKKQQNDLWLIHLIKHIFLEIKYYPLSRDIQHGSCIYCEELRLFKHDNEIQTAQAEIQECEPTMMSRLFDMMEQFGQRMNNFENQL